MSEPEIETVLVNPFKDHALDPYNHVNELMREDTATDLIRAANFLKDVVGQSGSIKTTDGATGYINTVWHSLLGADMYAEAATMNWGYNIMDCRPILVREYFDFMQANTQGCILGASSTGKSYSGVGWLYLDYQRDPDDTSIKLVTISSSKLEELLFSPLKSLHEHGVMETIGTAGPNFRFTHKPDNINVGFTGILVPQDQKGTGKVKGIKFYPRKKIHPIFGKSTRTRIFIDEFQDTSSGIRDDLESPEKSIGDNPHSMKIMLSGNPTEYALSGPFGQLSEPVDGWTSIDPEKDQRWKSKEGYEVLRLDGARSENVTYGQDLCAGMITSKAFAKKSNQINSSSYWTFARGMFPLSAQDNTLFNLPMLENRIGNAIFHEGAINVAFLDCSKGRDDAILGIGRFGQATGAIDHLGERSMFTSGTEDATRSPRLTLQVMELIKITEFNRDVLELADRVKAECVKRKISPEHFGCDASGLGEGTSSYLARYWGRILPVHNGEKPSDRKILKEDEKIPIEAYSRTCDELWYASYKWTNHDVVLFSPELEDKQKLFQQLSTRHKGKKASSGRLRIESKDEWKIRNAGQSPDEADTFNGLVHVCRMRTKHMPAMDKTGELEAAFKKPFNPPNVDVVESLHYNPLTKKDHAPKFDISKLRRTHIVGSK